MNCDLLITGGTVVDGTGNPPFVADVAIRGEKISEVGRIPAGENMTVLDARGLVVAPGFIDIHSHSDFTLAVDPRAVSAVSQGVTLEVVGNCGHGCAPMSDPAMVKTNLYGYQPGYGFPWNTVGDYLAHLESLSPAINIALLVPNGNLRLAVTGPVDRAATPDELRQMKRLLEESLDQGAWGFSTGLEYSIEKACSEDEVAELCRTVKQAGRFYATHTRNTQGEPEQTIDEAIRTAKAAEVPLQISHITSVARLSDRPRWAVERALEQVDEARRAGLDVNFDVHTRTFGTTHLSAILPPWVLEGGNLAVADRLKSPSTRAEMKMYPNLVSSLAGGDWSRIVVFASKAQPEIARRSIADIGRERGTDPYDTIYDLLLRESDDLHSLMIIAFAYRPEDVHIAFPHPSCMVGSDAITLATDGPLREQSFHGAYSWAAWFLRYFVQEKKVLSLPEAIRRITSLPAARLGIKDRGVIRNGSCADLAIFDPLRFQERATIFEPNQLAEGMLHVLVNGVVTIRDGKRTGDHGGHVLRAG